MWRRFIVAERRMNKIREMHFNLTFGFLRFKVVNKRTINILEAREDFRFSNFIWLN